MTGPEQRQRVRVLRMRCMSPAHVEQEEDAIAEWRGSIPVVGATIRTAVRAEVHGTFSVKHVEWLYLGGDDPWGLTVLVYVEQLIEVTP